MKTTQRKRKDIQLSEQSLSAIGELYLKEEIDAERKINTISLLFGLFFLAFVLVLPLITATDWNNPNVLSNISGVSLYTAYTAVIFFILRKKRYHPVIKYITVTFMVSIVTIIVNGYSFGVDYVHATRTISLNTYFLVIIISGLYQNPKLPVYSSAMVCGQYSLLFLRAMSTGLRVYPRMETFSENILTYDIWVVYMVLFAGAGLIAYLITLRHRKLSMLLHESLEQLYHEMEERRHSEEKARFFENYDRLTELPNFKHFQDRLEGQIQKAENRRQIFAVMCLGLDTFKHVNQLYGTDVGHHVLKEVGALLRKAYREDDLVSRFMGDKFLVIFSDLQSNYNLSDLIRKTRQVFEEDLFVDGLKIRLSAGAGISTFPNDGRTVDNLIERAETAMYGAKTAGKSVIQLYDNTMQKELDQRIHIERDLQDAVGNDEFRIVYQPKADINGRITGMEALLRWHSPDRGLVSPEVFIPIAERSGLIVDIGYHVMSLCCRQVDAWSKKGISPVRVTVNVSPHQFSRKDLVTRIRGIIDEYHIEPGWLGVEVTESGIMENEDDCIEKMNALKAMDMTISIDDFGKGYSSLTRLGNYPLDTLKIDKSFVDGIPASSASACIVRSIIDLAHNLDYHVVAEGVETREQVEFLSRNGCEMFQGYFFYKPLPPGEIEKLLAP